MVERAAHIVLIFVLFLSPALRAEQVHIAAASGPSVAEKEGQGWTFRGPNGNCWLVTAAHVVEDATSVQVTGSNGRTGFGREPQRLTHPKEVDIAFVPIEGALAKPCGGPIYGYENVGPILSRLSQSPGGLRLDRIFKGGQKSVFEAKLAGNENDGVHFVVRLPPSEDLSFSRGMSGTPVRLAGSGTEAGLPIGIVIEVLNDGTQGAATDAAAVRMDVIRRFILQDLTPIQPPPGDDLALEILDATPAREAACGPINALIDHPSCGWRPAGTSWSNIVLGFRDGPISRPEIRLRFAPKASAKSMIIRTSRTDIDAPPQWGVALPCRIAPEQEEVICRKNDATVQAIRIDIEGPEIEILDLGVYESTN